MLYHTTPHAVTGKTPSELMFNRTIRSKIPSLSDLATRPPNEDFADRDKFLKEKGKEITDQARHARKSSIEVGDTVLAARTGPLSKLDTPFQPVEYIVTDRVGARATIRDEQSGTIYNRNVAHLKKVEPVVAPDIERPSIVTAATSHSSETHQSDQTSQPSRVIRKPARLLRRLYTQREVDGESTSRKQREM